MKIKYGYATIVALVFVLLYSSVAYAAAENECAVTYDTRGTAIIPTAYDGSAYGIKSFGVVVDNNDTPNDTSDDTVFFDSSDLVTLAKRADDLLKTCQ